MEGSKAAPSTLTDMLRAKLAWEQGPRSTRELGRTLAMNHTTLWRFMAGGAPSAEVVDKLYARYFKAPVAR